MKREIRIPKQKRSIEKKNKIIEAAYKVFNEAFTLNEKPVLPPLLYRLAGLFYKNSDVKKLGKSVYYSKPLLK